MTAPPLAWATQLLAILFGAVGLSALLGWLDYVKLPAVGFLVAMTIHHVWRKQRTT